MLNCFCELPQLENPFTASEVLCDQDFNLIFNNDTSNLNADKIKWANTTDDYFTGRQKQDKFVGIGYITDKELQYRLRDFVNDVFPPYFIHNMWPTPSGEKIFPCTILVFSESSQWHCEGVQYPFQNHPDIKKGRFSTVCNFPLIGEGGSSRILFGEASNKLQIELKNLTDNFVRNNSVYINRGIYQNQKTRETSEDMSFMTGPSNDYICKPEIWDKEIEVIASKEKFDNPFLLNIARWHKVEFNSATPRVTLRLMAEREVPFEYWENLVDTNSFLQ